MTINPWLLTLEMKTLLITLLAIAAIHASALAVPLSQWTFDASTQSPALVDPKVTTSDFTVSAGAHSFVAGNPSSGSAINASGWAIADGVKWWQFTVTAQTGHLLDLTALTFDQRASATGPTAWSLMINGIAAAIAQATSGAFSASPMHQIDLTAATFQGLGSAEVRIFGYGAGSSAGTWRLDNVSLNGAVVSAAQPVPDEGSTALLLMIPGLALWSVHRRLRVRDQA